MPKTGYISGIMAINMKITDKLLQAVDGLSPTAIAEKAQISRTLVYRVQQGKPVNTTTAQKIFDACRELRKLKQTG